MDRDSVLRHLRAWADGVDPATGEMLPADHPGQRPETLRVVFAALALLQAQQVIVASVVSRANGGGRPRNAGRSWTLDDDVTLANAFDAGDAVGALASRMERTRGSINARLVKLGKIDPPPGLRLRGEGVPRDNVRALG